jgi:hypothetical protein
MAGWTLATIEAIGLVIAAENFGFWRRMAERRVEPDLGKPEMKCILEYIVSLFYDDEV